MNENNVEEFYQFEQEFRDSISTVDEKGKRIWVYPKKPSGRFHNWRIVVTVLLLALLFSGPFIKISGRPLFLFNIFERKFIIGGIAFWPQDFHLFGLAMIAFFVFIILFTVVFGRIWCGWACPQTLFMEMVFRKIEYWIEGDANQQRKLDNSPWTAEKVVKKSIKHLLFILISILISHTLMAYLIGLDEVKTIVTASPFEHVGGFIGIVIFTGIFYWVFAYFREQACTVVCPYGRLQGVLLNKNSIVIAYDWLRGEPRGKLHKDTTREKNGDCIDCKLCVHACPTGIDIRNGTQLECVNCTACIDACDEVMDKVGKPRGLIRYSSYEAIKSGVEKIFQGRVIGYGVILVLLITLLSFLMATRADVEATVLRVPGMLYQETEDGMISNLYNVQLVNKTFDEVHLELRLKDHPEGIIQKVGSDELEVEGNETAEAVYFIKLPKSDLTATKTTLTLELIQDGKVIDKIHTSFLGPFIQKKK